MDANITWKFVPLPPLVYNVKNFNWNGTENGIKLLDENQQEANQFLAKKKIVNNNNKTTHTLHKQDHHKNKNKSERKPKSNRSRQGKNSCNNRQTKSR
jgi:hypothetical protein